MYAKVLWVGWQTQLACTGGEAGSVAGGRPSSGPCSCCLPSSTTFPWERCRRWWRCSAYRTSLASSSFSRSLSLSPCYSPFSPVSVPVPPHGHANRCQSTAGPLAFYLSLSHYICACACIVRLRRACMCTCMRVCVHLWPFMCARMYERACVRVLVCS